MQVYIDNIGIVTDSTIEINDITIITGYNKSGKTTIGKSLNAIFSAVTNLEEKAFSDKYYYVISGIVQVMASIFSGALIRDFDDINKNCLLGNAIINWFSSSFSKDKEGLFRNCIEAKNVLVLISESSNEEINGIFRGARKKIFAERLIRSRDIGDISRAIENIDNYIQLIDDDPRANKYANTKIIIDLRNEFHSQINPLKDSNKVGIIKVYMDKKDVFNISIKKNDNISEKDLYNAINNIEVDKVLMIDSADMLDRLTPDDWKHNNKDVEALINVKTADLYYDAIKPNSRIYTLAEYLNPTVSVYESIGFEDKAQDILNQISEAFDDELILQNDKIVCSDSKLDVRNLASGAKIFAILHQLLLKGQLNNKTLLIMDEPDNHLHPEWQGLLAKTLLLLNRELGVKVLMTTHNTNTIYAFEVYNDSKVKDIRVYDTQILEDNYSVTCNDVTDDLKIVYEKLGRPFINLRKEEITKNSDEYQ